MTSRSNYQLRATRTNRTSNRTNCEARKRKGRTSNSDCLENDVKRYCVEPIVMDPIVMVMDPKACSTYKLVDECTLEDLSLEAHEFLESPVKEQQKENERKRSLRCHISRDIPMQGTLQFIHGTYDKFIDQDIKGTAPLPQLPWADPEDVWHRMKKREKDYQKEAYYLKRHPALQIRMRSILLDWLIEVCEVYRLHRETFHLAVDFVDRYLSSQRNVAKQRLQLIGVTSLFIAAKIEEIYPPKITEFAYVTDGACTVDEITKQELLILQALKWKLSPVSSNSWLTTYLQILSNKMSRPQRKKPETSFEFPKFPPLHLAKISQLMDLCLLDIKSLQFTNSVIAASALHHVLPQVDITAVTGYSWNRLYECVHWLVPFNQVIKENGINNVKQFDKIPADDAHNIQVHDCGISLLDQVHEKLKKASTLETITRTSPVPYGGILTPPSSAKKDY